MPKQMSQPMFIAGLQYIVSKDDLVNLCGTTQSGQATTTAQQLLWLSSPQCAIAAVFTS